MSKVFIFRKKHVQLLIVIAALIIVASVFFSWNQARTVSGQPAETRIIDMITGEFETTLSDGKELEVYVWHPGTVVVKQGERIELRISGVNGSSHPFTIEKLGIKGIVEKGKTTTVRFTADKKGVYPIVCLSHTDMTNGGPMTGYIVVQ